MMDEEEKIDDEEEEEEEEQLDLERDPQDRLMRNID